MMSRGSTLAAAGLGLLMGLASALDGASAQDSSEARSVSVDGLTRDFVVHWPASRASATPIVFVFHGAGGNPGSIARNTGMDQLADRYGFIAVYPAGTGRTAGRGGSWNVGGSYSSTAVSDVGFVRAMLDDIGRSASVDRTRIYAVGFSMGGVLSYKLACEMSQTFAAVAVVSGTMVEPSCRPQIPVAVLHIHGTDDDRIPINGGAGEKTRVGRSWPAPERGIETWARADACESQPVQTEDGCRSYSGCRAPVEFCAIQGGGHAWPSGGAERVWTFFAANPKR